MTDQQLYLSSGIPSVLALLGILINVSYFVSINGRITSLESRLDGRIASLENRIDGRINGLDDRVHTLQDVVIGKLAELDNRLVRLEERLKP